MSLDQFFLLIAHLSYWIIKLIAFNVFHLPILIVRNAINMIMLQSVSFFSLRFGLLWLNEAHLKNTILRLSWAKLKLNTAIPRIQLKNMWSNRRWNWLINETQIQCSALIATVAAAVVVGFYIANTHIAYLKYVFLFAWKRRKKNMIKSKLLACNLDLIRKSLSIFH